MHWPFPRAAYIDHDRAFQHLVKTLENEALIAVDTESNSLYAYRERVCLIQISTRTKDYIVDPLRIADLSPLGGLLADSGVEKVFHAAEYDLMCLKRDYGFVVHNLFDTMVAARICGLKAVGLGKLLAEYCGVNGLDKSHQRDDWGRRPLPAESLLYAQMDTHYLPTLRDRLLAELETTGRMTEAREIFTDYASVPAANHVFDPDGYWRIGIPADLNRRQMAILRELYLLRERLAEERDCPPFKVFADRLLVALAEAGPDSIPALRAIRGMTAGQTRRYAGPILQALERGRKTPLPHPPSRPPEIDPLVVERFAALRDWRRRRGEQRGVDSDVILSKDAIWALAYQAPTTLADLQDIPGLGPWRRQTYGAEILEVLRPFADGSAGE
jgi:ribonuclease D